LGVEDVVVADGCILLLGRSGTTRRSDWTTIGTPGQFNFRSLTVESGGEVTVTRDQTDEQQMLDITVRTNNN
jgi:hypothetical protein